MPASAPGPVSAPTSAKVDCSDLYEQMLAELDGREVACAEDVSSEAFWTRNQELLQSTIEPLLFEALLAGDLDTARLIGAERWARIGRVGSARLCTRRIQESAAAQALLVAHPYLRKISGLLTPDHQAVVGTTISFIEQDLYENWEHLSSDRLRRLRQWEQREEDELIRSWVPATDGVFDDLDVALRAARANVFDAKESGPIIVDLRLGFEAFQAFRRRHRIEEVWALTERDLSVAAAAHLDAMVGKQPIQLRALHTLTPGPWLGEALAKRQVGARLHHGGDLDTFAVGDLSLDEHRDSVSEWESTVGWAGLPDRTEAEVFGPRACDHQGALWRQVGGDVVLSCERCFTPVVARTPAHRCPPGSPVHEVLSGNPDHYLLEKRFSDVIHDRPIDLTSTLEDLRLRDGYVSLEPRVYATAEVSGQSARGAGSVTSVAAAMNRR